MMTFKQLEALYWIEHLGGFAAAARHLHTTQSAISKRIQELEADFGTQLFDRTRRGAWLTESGEQMLELAKHLLEQRDAAMERFSRMEMIRRQVRIGVTELTALTWLPRLIGAIRERYPGVSIEPDVDLSTILRDKLLAGELDLIIVPDTLKEPRVTWTRLGSVENVWMCKPGLVPNDKPLRLQELDRYTLLTHAEKSGTGLLYDRWLRAQGINPHHTIRTNSLVALIGMTVSGLGVSYLPRTCVSWLIDTGMLEVVNARRPPPEVRYVALRRAGSESALIAALVALAREHCNFSRMFQTES
ncbi:LysR family transcriptional regulator [Aquabacter spiritensis]|uniref:DNA-binding transcriptional LysR family regulator n=1 Tax=Aquabacter spiritensis TaxID=933073 RepID=A0A4R3LUA5_9HYPH|nr:LysR family transcriptional regulator [Aquabacter spiritensis]TCT03576.1 DNA-binding transcriptional LysR family regulator [Aquabacter spiritensis]